jgi:hypothetical protein
MNIHKIALWLTTTIVIIGVLPREIHGKDRDRILDAAGVVVHFEDRLGRAAKEIVGSYGGIKKELENTFGWNLDFRPTVILINDSETFEKIAGSKLFMAVAISPAQRIVIDASKLNTHHFSLGITLKHELCHLLIHHHIRNANLPKWLDEGVCQWVSDGVSEVIRGPKYAVSKAADLYENSFRLNRLATTFPREKKPLMLAYDQSRSLVAFVHKRFGGAAVLDILNRLKAGKSIDDAVQDSLSMSVDELENRWRRHLKKKSTWFSYIAANIYGIIFFLGALMTVMGFIRYWTKKRKYSDDEDDWV